MRNNPPVIKQDINIRIAAKSYTHNLMPIGSAVLFTTTHNSICLGVVVKHTLKRVVLIYGFRSFSYSNSWHESFDNISRSPDECVPASIEDVDDLQKVEELIDIYNTSKNTNIQLKFT